MQRTAGSREEEDFGRRVGRELEAAREGQGLSLEAVGRAVQAHGRLLGELERGDFDALPSPLLARTLLVRYANHLGLDGEALADRAFELERPLRPAVRLTPRWRKIGAVLIVLAVGGIATLWATVLAPYNDLSRGIAGILHRVAPGIFVEAGPQRVLVLGSAEAAGTGLDNPMIVRVAEDGLGLLSVPRNASIPLPGRGEDTMGDIIAAGDTDLARQGAARLAGTEVPYYVAISPEGVKRVVDATGGVQVDVPESVGRAVAGGREAALRPGPQTLNGEQALVYLAGEDLTSDSERARRQQAFLSVLFRQALGPGDLLSNPGTALTMLEYTETNMSGLEAVQMLGRLRTLGDGPDASLEVDALPARETETGDRRGEGPGE